MESWNAVCKSQKTVILRHLNSAPDLRYAVLMGNLELLDILDSLFHEKLHIDDLNATILFRFDLAIAT